MSAGLQSAMREFYEALLNLDLDPYRERDEVPTVPPEDAKILRQMPAGVRETAHIMRRTAA